MDRRQALASMVALAASRNVSAGTDEDTSGLLSISDFEALAEKRIVHGAWERIQGAAADELTLRWNKEGWQHLRLRPRALVDVSKLDTRVTVLGQQMAFPILLAPTGGQGLIRP